MDAIELALQAAEHERAGRGRRVDDVLAWAAVTFWLGDDYLHRELLYKHHHGSVRYGDRKRPKRLRDPGATIVHFRFIEAATVWYQ